LYFFAAIISSISPSILSTYEKDPYSLQLQTLISNCNNHLNTIFGLYKTLINHNQIPTLHIFKNLLTACLDLKQPERAKHIWKEMENYSIIPDYWCFGLLLRVCGKIGDSGFSQKAIHKGEE
jgi:pentatricopeptide repeat protein